MAADDIEGFKYFHPHLEIPEIKLTPEQSRAVRSVLMGESPEEWARKEELRELGFDGKVTPETMQEAIDRRIGHGPWREFCSKGCCGPELKVWEWKCPHCPFETDSLTEGQAHVKPGSGCPGAPVGDKKLRDATGGES